MKLHLISKTHAKPNHPSTFGITLCNELLAEINRTTGGIRGKESLILSICGNKQLQLSHVRRVEQKSKISLTDALTLGEIQSGMAQQKNGLVEA